MKNSAKRDTRPLKGHYLTLNVHQGGIPKDHLVEKMCLIKKNLQRSWSIFICNKMFNITEYPLIMYKLQAPAALARGEEGAPSFLWNFP